jgi:ribosome recycling factor
MIEVIKKDLSESVDKTLKALSHQLSRVRTGRANPSIFDGLTVDYYGAPTPLSQVGQMSTPEARLLQIQPFDKSIITEIERAIINSNLGLTPTNDGNLIRISFPALTEDKRKDLVKTVKKYGEEAKIALRGHRRDQNEVIKKAEKDKEISEDDSKRHQTEVQKLTDQFVVKIDEIVTAKEQELMTI